jgi:hypothetical protein
MRDPMERSQRLTDGGRWWTFMRLLRLDDLMTSYTNAPMNENKFGPSGQAVLKRGKHDTGNL